MSTRVTVTFMTRYGVGFVWRFYVPAGIVDPTHASITALIAAVEAACAARGISIEITQADSNGVTAGTGPTICEDKAVLIVPDDSGEVHTFKIPAPKLATGTTIFGADGATLDKTNANVLALQTALSTYGYGQSGDALDSIRKGHRAGGKRLSA